MVLHRIIPRGTVRYYIVWVVNLVASLSSSFSSICKKAFSMSAAKAMWLIRKVNSILGSSCIRLGPVCRQSLRLNAVGDFFADAS